MEDDRDMKLRDMKLKNNEIMTVSGIFLLASVLVFLIIPTALGADTIFLVSESSGNATGCTDLDCLDDVIIALPVNGSIIKYNGTYWIVGSDDNGNSTLLNSAVHTDTVTQSPSNGSLIYANGNPEKWDEFLVGTLGQHLMIDNNTGVLLPQWDYGDTLQCNDAGDCPLDLGDDLVECAHVGVTIKLPDVTSASLTKIYYIEKLTPDGDICIIDADGTDTINGQLTYNLTNQYQGVLLTQWLFNQWRAIATYDDYIAGNGITIIDNTGYFTIASFCTNTGSGEAICESSNNINSLIATSPITISDTTGDLTIDCPTCLTSTPLIGQLVGHVFVSKTMTNIGTTNVDIYVASFDAEDMMIIDCSNVIDMRVVYMWDYVGTGTHTIRWVDASDNANVLYTTTRVADADAIDSGWFTKPAWCTGIKTIEQQGSSTTAGDDPQAKGYVIFAR